MYFFSTNLFNLSCPNCHSAVDVYHPSEKLIKEYKDYEEKKNDK